MREEYDFSQSMPNPHSQGVKKKITTSLDDDIADCFRCLADKASIPHHSLVNLYLKGSVQSQRKFPIE